METRMQVENSLFDAVTETHIKASENSVGQGHIELVYKQQKANKVKEPNTKELKLLLERQDYCCAISGIPLDPETAELDHIQPLSRGGTHELANIQIVDTRVNRMKGTMMMDEFIEICCKIATKSG